MSCTKERECHMTFNTQSHNQRPITTNLSTILSCVIGQYDELLDTQDCTQLDDDDEVHHTPTVHHVRERQLLPSCPVLLLQRLDTTTCLSVCLSVHTEERTERERGVTSN